MIQPGQNQGAENQEGMEESGGPLDAIQNLAELQGKPEGAQCRVEVIVEVTPEGVQINSAKYIADANGKTKDEYLKMPEAGREEYDKTQVLGQE